MNGKKKFHCQNSKRRPSQIVSTEYLHRITTLATPGLGRLNILALSLFGIVSIAVPVHAQITTTQTLTSGGYSVAGTTSIDVSSGNGIYANGTLDTLTNAGSISGITGIYNDGDVDTILNNGAISGVSAGIINVGQIGALINNGIITGGSYFAIVSGYRIGTLSNSGTIIGGISNSNNAITALLNSGLITSSGNAINSEWGSTIRTITNSGTISADNAAIFLYSPLVGFSIPGGTINTLSNSGVIRGGTYALQLASGSRLDYFTNTGLIGGGILNDSGTAMTIAGGSGTIFGTLTGNGLDISQGNIGDIVSTSGLTFTGNHLLNDNVNVGSTSFTNTGTLQVNNPVSIFGNYVQGNGAALLVGVGSGATISGGNLTDTGYGRLVVYGSANLDGSNITLKSLGYAFAAGQRYVVVAANTGISNTGATYCAGGYQVTGTILSDTNDNTFTDLVLTLSSTASNVPATYATDRNAAAALNGLFRYAGTDSRLLSVFNPAAALGSSASANRAGAQLSPTAILQAAGNSSDAVNRAVFNVTANHLDGLRLAQASNSGIATGERSVDPALWGQFFGGGATQDERDGVSGYRANYRGVLLGSDLQATESWRAGGLFSAAKTNVGNSGNNTGSSASVNSYGLTAYAGYDGKPWYVNVMAGLARQQYSTVRAVGFTGFNGVANGRFNGLQGTASVQLGYPLALAADTTLTPLAGLTYNKLRQNGYTETGGNGAALTVQAATTTSLKSDIGAKLERKLDTSYGMLTSSAQLRWRHEFQDSRLNTAASFAADPSGATSFTTVGAGPLRNTGAMVLGMTLARSNNLSLASNYTLEAGRGYHSQTADVRLRWQY